MKKFISILFLSIVISTITAYIIGFTVDQNLDKYVGAMIEDSMDAIAQAGHQPQGLVQAQVLGKKRGVFSTQAKIALISEGNTIVKVPVTVHHGPFWIEVDAQGDRKLVSGLFGIEMRQNIFGIAGVVNVEHGFLHHGDVRISVEEDIEGASLSGGFELSYKSHWNDKSFTITAMNMSLDHLDFNGLSIKGLETKSQSPAGIMQAYHKETSAEFTLDHIHTDSVTVEDVELSSHSQAEWKESEIHVQVGLVDNQSAQMRIEDLEVDAKIALPHMNLHLLEDISQYPTHFNREMLQGFDNMEFSATSSFDLNGDSVDFSMELSTDFSENGRGFPACEMEACDDQENAARVSYLMNHVDGSMKVSWDKDCENSESIICLWVNDAIANGAKAKGNSFEVNLSDLFESLQPSPYQAIDD